MSSKIVKSVACIFLCLGMNFAATLQAEGIPTSTGTDVNTDITTETTPGHDAPPVGFCPPYGGGG